MKKIEKGLKKKENIIYYIVFSFVFLFLAVYFSFNCYGASIHGDEYFSMGFANNSEDFLFLTIGTLDEYAPTGWLNGDFLHDWLTVQEDERFMIMPIHRNVRRDVHPPLYFMLLNWISSFFVDQLTLFPGYFINVIAGLLICLFMYLIMRKIFKNKWVALVPLLFWGTSMAGSINMTYIRMYAALSALTLLCLYIHLRFLYDHDRKILVLLLFCTTIGTLTHYYYYVMQFVLLLMTVVILLYKKQIKDLFMYGGSLLLGEVLSFIPYPYAFKHMFFSSRGVEAQEFLAKSDWEYYKNFFWEYLQTINRFAFSNQFKRILLCLIVLFFFVSALKFIATKFNCFSEMEKFHLTESNNSIFTPNGKGSYYIVVISAVLYFLILFKISYSSSWMYISPIFPLIAMATVGIFWIVFNQFRMKKSATIFFICTCIIFFPKLFGMIQWGMNSNQNIRLNHKEIVQYSDHCDVLFLYDEWNNLYDNQILELMEFDQICAKDINEIEETDWSVTLRLREDEDNLLIYIPVRVAAYDKVITRLTEMIGAKTVSKINEEQHAIYYIER